MFVDVDGTDNKKTNVVRIETRSYTAALTQCTDNSVIVFGGKTND